MKKLLLAIILLLNIVHAQDKLDYSPKFTGYVRAWYQADFSTDQGQYLVKQARLNIAGAVNEYASYKLQVDFTRLGKLSSTTTTVNNVKVVNSVSATFSDILLDAAAIITPFKNFDLTAGQFKVPYGTDNLRSDQVLDFANRPLITNVSPSIRDIGLMITYKIKGDFGAELIAGSFNGSGFNKTENDKTLDYVFRAVVSPLKEFNLSANYYRGKSSGSNLGLFNLGFDYKYNSVFVDAEYSSRTSSLGNVDMKANSYFAYLTYDFTFTDLFVKNIIPALRFEMYDPNTDQIDDETSRFTFGLTFHFAKISFAHFRINYEKYNMKGVSDNPDKLILEIQTRF